MFSTLRHRFGIPGVISVIALVFALVGGAFAANDLGSSSKGATASAKKALKGPRGPRGPKGATGAAGPAGPAGAPGAKGDAGAAGAKGEKGATGTNGVSVTSSVEPKGAKCAEGGSKFVSSSGTTFACNGAKGVDGEDGEPWTAGGTLPPGATQTGTWYLNNESPLFQGGPSTTISFPIPLSAPVPESKVVVTSSVAPDPNCNDDEGSAPSAGNPEADPGFLCLFVSLSNGSPSIIALDPETGGIGAMRTGALLLEESGASDFFALGSFAVSGALAEG